MLKHLLHWNGLDSIVQHESVRTASAPRTTHLTMSYQMLHNMYDIGVNFIGHPSPILEHVTKF